MVVERSSDPGIDERDAYGMIESSTILTVTSFNGSEDPQDKVCATT